MTFYDLMAPLETAVEDARKLPKRPVLGITTPEATPTNAHGSRFEWNGWEEGADHIQSCVKKHSSHIKPDSPQSLPSLDHPSPGREDLSHLPKCRKCGLTAKQHEMVRAYICGHICRDIPDNQFCPDIDALHLTKKDCTIHGKPKESCHTRRRSSLSQPPILAYDESSHEDMYEEKPSDNVAETYSTVDVDADKALSGSNEAVKEVRRQNADIPGTGSGDADWRKQYRVEKAMKQMLFGDARIAPHIVREHTHRLKTGKPDLVGRNRDVSTDQHTIFEYDDADHSALTAVEKAH